MTAWLGDVSKQGVMNTKPSATFDKHVNDLDWKNMSLGNFWIRSCYVINFIEKNLWLITFDPDWPLHSSIPQDGLWRCVNTEKHHTSVAKKKFVHI